jgi:hypothetical protein
MYLCGGKSYTTSSCRIPQGGNAARVDGRSGVMYGTCHFFLDSTQHYVIFVLNFYLWLKLF